MGQPLRGKRVLITSGPCRERVDDVRILTTRSSGQMGKSFALQAFRLGADVTVVHADEFPCVKNVKAESADEMRAAVLQALSDTGGVDLYISAAAISDFAPKAVTGKIPSGKPVSLELEPLPKLLDEVIRKWAPAVIAFKLGTAQEKKAEAMLRRGIAMVLVNTPETMGSSSGEYHQVTQDGTVLLRGTKDDIARIVWETVCSTILSS
jgi:phosphopantothenoylcysteine decarboxylase/phosphopantothenate--cysteine ligase